MRMVVGFLGRRQTTALGLVFFWLLVMVGCGTTSAVVTYYTLNPKTPREPSGLHTADPYGLVLGIGPIHLPAYLDRLPMVARTGVNRLQVNEYHRWAAPLHHEVQRVMGENLRRLTGLQRIVFHPWTRDRKPDAVVELEIHAFEAQPNGDVVLNATMVLHDWRSAGSTPLYRTFQLIQSVAPSGGYDAAVAAQNTTLFDLSRHIAAEILTLSRN